MKIFRWGTGGVLVLLLLVGRFVPVVAGLALWGSFELLTWLKRTREVGDD